MGLFSRWRRGGGGVGGDGRRQVLDREATSADLDHLRAFAKSREFVAFYVEPETTATDTTVVAVAFDGEWTRRRVGTPKAAEKLARILQGRDPRRPGHGLPARDARLERPGQGRPRRARGDRPPRGGPRPVTRP